MYRWFCYYLMEEILEDGCIAVCKSTTIQWVYGLTNPLICVLQQRKQGQDSFVSLKRHFFTCAIIKRAYLFSLSTLNLLQHEEGWVCVISHFSFFWTWKALLGIRFTIPNGPYQNLFKWFQLATLLQPAYITDRHTSTNLYQILHCSFAYWICL